MSQQVPTSMTYEQTGAPSGLSGEHSLIRAITQNIPGAAVFVVDQDFRYLLAGGDGLKDAGMTPADFEGRFLANVIPPEQLNQALADYTAILAGETFIREHPVGNRFYRTRGRLIKGTNGTRDVALAVSYDITDEVKVAELGQFAR